MKKFISIFLVIILTISSFAITTTAYADDNEKFTFINGVLTYKNNVTELSNSDLPLTFEGEFNRNGIVKVILPDSITAIPKGMFSECTNITSVTLSQSLTGIPVSTFNGCKRLTEISIPSNILEIGEKAFNNCSSLSSVNFEGNKVETIGQSAFANCIALSNFSIPENTIEIGSSAFYNCTSLTNLIIPDSITSITEKCFSGCSGVTSIKFSNNLERIGKQAFYNCSSVSELIIPNTVTYIAESAFSNCSNASKIIIPNKITTLEASVFNGCKSIKTIEIPTSVTMILSSAFANCVSLENIIVPETVYVLDDAVFNGCSSLKTAVIPKTLNSVNSSLFKNCSSLTSVRIPESAKVISNSAFYNCKALTNVVIPDNIKTIGASAFANCENITDIYMSENIETIGNNAFYGCKEIGTIIIPKNVNFLGDQAFYNCSMLNKVYVYSALDTIGNNAFGKVPKSCVFFCDSNEYTFNYALNNGFNVECLNHLNSEFRIIKATTDKDGSFGIKCIACGSAIGDNTIIYKPVDILIEKEVFEYSGKPITPTISVVDSVGNIISSDNYIVNYQNNINTGTANITVEFIGDYYSGNLNKNFNIINSKNLGEYNLSKSVKVTYPINNISPEKTFTINVQSDSYYDFSFAGYYPSTVENDNYSLILEIYNQRGDSIKKIINGNNANADGKLFDFAYLTKGSYAVSMYVIYNSGFNNDKAVTVSISKHSTHKYQTVTNCAKIGETGSIIKSCQVCGDEKSNTTIPAIKSVTLSNTSAVFSNKEIKPSVIITDSNGNKLSSKFYEVKYPNSIKKVGKYNIIVEFKDQYSGAVSLLFTIKPCETEISSLNGSKKSFKVKWKKKTTQVTGYQIQYSTDSKFKKNNKTITIKKNKITSTTIKKLKSKKKYFVRIRTYKTVNGKKIYSSWSKAKTIKTT